MYIFAETFNKNEFILYLTHKIDTSKEIDFGQEIFFKQTLKTFIFKITNSKKQFTKKNIFTKKSC